MLEEYDDKLRDLHYKENYQEEHILEEHRSYGNFIQKKKTMMEENRRVFMEMHKTFTFRSKFTRMNHFRQFQEDLPIYSKKKEFIEAFKSNQVIIFKSNAGSGKSTQLPQYLLDCTKGRVLITEPRVIAAENVARRVQDEWRELGKDAGSKVFGYMAGPNIELDRSASQIVYMSEVGRSHAARVQAPDHQRRGTVPQLLRRVHAGRGPRAQEARLADPGHPPQLRQKARQTQEVDRYICDSGY
jgi:hypothetical protein